ncbi:hypothetical protein GCM10009102_25760 [Sphingomonas insulae]|uniref:Uncharacterized protein n=2 Tax=Sphingomonas insulae TaxID=424800 RepID=A0ABP3T157_9SPHN
MARRALETGGAAAEPQSRDRHIAGTHRSCILPSPVTLLDGMIRISDIDVNNSLGRNVHAGS